MENLLNRYRNITVLLLAIFAQLVLLAYQVKNVDDVPMIRVWAVSAVTPLAKVLEVVRSGAFGFVEGYITLHDTHQENQHLRQEVGRLKMENQFLKTQLTTAERAKALAAFQAQTQSRTLAARVIGMGAGFNSKVVFVDRGSGAGVEKGMAVVTPDGIVGKVISAYPLASMVMLVTDPNFAAGVISQKHHVRGALKGHGDADCKVDYVQNEANVDVGEWFYTSGDDRIFPKGFPVGVTRVVRAGQSGKDIDVEPSGLQHGLDEVLILLEGVHQAIPEGPPVASNEPMYLAPLPPATANAGGPQQDASKGSSQTDADRLRERYKQIGEAQNHTFGEGLPGSKPPDFNIKVPGTGTAAPPAAPAPKPEATRPATPATTPNGAAPAQPPPAKPAATPNGGAPAQPPAAKPPAAPAPKKTPEPEPPQPKPSKPVDPFL